MMTLQEASERFGQPVSCLSVPGTVDGRQIITLKFWSGDSIEVNSATVEGAWALLRAEAPPRRHTD